jgi:mono/diheme cytochrome c family protein
LAQDKFKNQKFSDYSYHVIFLLGAILAIFFVVFPAFAGAQKIEGNACIACHEDIWQEAQDSVHSRNGILCQDCHGGDPTKSDPALAKSPETGFRGIPEKKQIAEICGKCHADVEFMNAYGVRTDQLERYKTSVHGKKLLIEGDHKVAVCSDCHGYHDVLPISDANSPVYPLNIPKTCNRCHGNDKLMSGYGLPTDMFEKYSKSVHGQALFEKKDFSVANCASCHGSHGAVPPGVKEISATCGKCHINEKKYFLESVHAKANEEGNFSECISCHSNHAIQKPTPALYETACVQCHDEKSDAVEQGRKISGMLYHANEKFKLTEILVKKASMEGIFVEEETASLEEAKSNVTGMAPLQHTLSIEKITDLDQQANQRFAEIEKNINQKRQNLKMRKIALIPIWIFIAVMAIVLWMKYNRLKSGK